MSDPTVVLIASTASICLLVTIANLILASRSISSGAAIAFAVAFAACGLAWTLTAIVPPGSDLLDLLVNTIAVVGTSAIWCGLRLRAGFPINWGLIGALAALWLLPFMGVVFLNWRIGTHVPFAMASMTIGLLSSVWCMHKKRGQKNAGDLALITWLLLLLPVSAYALLLGVDTVDNAPETAWYFYLRLAPTLLTGIGLFTLLGFTLDAVNDSRELARTDSLTGLLNRRAFDNELAIGVARAERYQRELALILLDIDQFKALNDSYGHPVGDRVIKAVADLLQEKCRQIDLVARIGGEEFAVILADTAADAALQLAERLRAALAQTPVGGAEFTASFGVADARIGSRMDAETLMKAADEALYAAKEAGRNRVSYAKALKRNAETLAAAKS